MQITSQTNWIAFARNKCIAAGKPRDVVTAAKVFADAHPAANMQVFDAVTSVTIELDLRGALTTVLRRLPKTIEDEPGPALATAPSAGPGVGRPKLGVVAREVTLLPRHWEWLAGQPGGASVALRKLVEHALRNSKAADRKRAAQDSAYRFMLDMAGDNQGFEEAARALFATDLERLQQLVAAWPKDIRQHLLKLAHAISDSESGNQ